MSTSEEIEEIESDNEKESTLTGGKRKRIGGLVRLVIVSDAPTLPISQTYPHLSRNACTECAPE